MPVTIKDIAKEANVSFQAVSAVLNSKDNCRVSPQKRELILGIAERLGYQTNFGYKLMHNAPTHTVAIVSAMHRITCQEHIKDLLILLFERLNKKNYATYFNDQMSDSEFDNVKQINDLIMRGVRHFIFIGTPYGFERIIEILDKAGIGFISFQNTFGPSLSSDGTSARELIDYLYKETGENFRLMFPNAHGQRFDALCSYFPNESPEILAEKFLYRIPSVNWENIDFKAAMFKYGYNSTRELLEKNPEVKGLLFLQDEYALGAIKFAHDKKLKVGKDILIIGHNHTFALQCCVSPVVSVEFPLEEITERLVTLLFSDNPTSEKFKLRIHYS